jgi:hypothetical protein
VGGVCCQAPGGGKKGWGKIRGQEAADAQTSFFFSFASFFGSCLVSTCSAVFSFVSVSCAGECQRPYMAALLRVSVGDVKRFDSLLRTFVRSFVLFIWYTFFFDEIVFGILPHRPPFPNRKNLVKAVFSCPVRDGRIQSDREPT